MSSSNSHPVIRAVCFDLDGLMFNTEDVFHLAGSELLRRRNFEMTREMMSAMLGRRAEEGFATLKTMVALEETVEQLIDESRGIFYELLEQHLVPMPGLMELLDLIESKRLPKGVATSSRRGYLEHLLQRFKLLDRFPLRLAAEDVTDGKPNPEIYLRAAVAFHVKPSEMLVFEDSEAGTKAGVSAGAVVVSVPHGHTAHHDFSGARFIATSLMDSRVVELIGGAIS